MAGKSRPKGRPWQPLRPAVSNPPRLPDTLPSDLREVIERAMEEDRPVRVWMNDRYVVQEIERPEGVTELSIRRIDREWPRDWRHFQRIKNEVCGPEREGCELYPAESRLVDGANQFHIFVLPEGARFALGYEGPRSVGDQGVEEWRQLQVGGKQRPLNQLS